MQRRLFEQSLATVSSVVLATMLLTACGPGATSSSSPDAVNTQRQAADDTATQPVAAASGTPATQADAANPASFSYATDPVQSVQASLAADSEQVAPVMSYAPGDDPPARSSNDSSNTATTRQ